MGRLCLRLSVGLSVAALVFCPFFSATAEESPDSIWVNLDEGELGALPKRATSQNGYIQPFAYRALLLDDYLLAKTLDSAPLEDPDHPMKSDESDAIIWLPMPDGTDVPFSFVEAPIMEQELADKYPGIRTYLGNALDGSNRYVRFDRTQSGFHALIRGGGDVYIEPGEKDGAYLSYRASDYPAVHGEFTCNVKEGPEHAEIASSAKISFGGTLRTFRLAVACTGEYANFHGSTSQTGPGNAIAAITTVVNRVTSIYEQELNVRFLLVGSNDQIVFFDPATDPFTGNLNTDVLILESQAQIHTIIGAPNYDIGQTFCTAPGGASLTKSACKPNKKALGCSGSSSPTGDPFAISIACHEIGHQLGAHHTFNSTDGGCGNNNRDEGTAFERGSGSTIMGYAAAGCGFDALQPNADSYFHSASLEQISSFLAANTCSVNSSTLNSPPKVSAGSDFTIPKATPFTLTAQGSDLDGDPVFFAWEERDKGPAQNVIVADNGKSPLFRCFPPSDLKRRTFPKLEHVISGEIRLDEVLPILSRTMKFVVVAGHVNGAFATDETKITVEASAGPFRVKSPNGGEIVQGGGGAKRKITWDIAGTDTAPINAASVRIFLSKDGGLTFPILLNSSTPNDGKQKVTIPDEATSNARIRIQAEGNIFFDISDANFTIGPNEFDIIGAWDPPEGSIGRLTFRADGTATFCEGPCEDGTYTYAQTDSDSGELQLFRENGDPVDDGGAWVVEIVDINHITIVGHPFTRV